MILFPGELEAIAQSKSVEIAEIADLTETIQQFEDVGISARKIRNIDGVCVFLTPENLCGIQDAKPYQCRNGPNNFLSSSMIEYECMKDVIIESNAEELDMFRKFLYGN